MERKKTSTEKFLEEINKNGGIASILIKALDIKNELKQITPSNYLGI